MLDFRHRSRAWLRHSPPGRPLRTRLDELAPLPENPFISIVVPCLDEEAYIESVVRGALSQRWPAERLEVLIADGRSSDGTREIVERLMREDARVRLVDNPDRYQSAGMNRAIRRAHGDVIVRMDAHADYAPDYVEASVRALRRTGAMNVGGAARARAKGFFQRALCAALASPMGVGGSAYRDPDREGFVESVFNGAFRREAFEIAGLYDPEAITNEDAELNQRILEAGGTIYLSRDVIVHYYPRTSLEGLARQYFSYGQGRARTFLTRGRLLSVRPVIPFATVTVFALLGALALAAPVLSPLLAVAAASYGGAVLAESIRVASRTSVRYLPLLVAIFPVMHVGHGLGFWSGLLRFAGANVRQVPRLVPSRRAEITHG